MKKNIIVNSSDLQTYVKDIKKIPIISHQRQDEIFKSLQSNDITEGEKKVLYDELVTGNLRFVISIAKTYVNQGMDIMDLISEGNIGLMKAAERFDPYCGLRFISYAVWWIRQTIKSSLNENSRTIRIPANLIQERRKNMKINESLQGLNDDTLNNLPYCINLDNTINDDGDTLLDIIPNKNISSPDEIHDSPDEIRKKINQMLSILDNREKIIIEKTYGLAGVESNLDELGDEFNCTKERIRQIKDKSIKKLRNESYNLLKHL
jgi:RNA polymerase primary sigma factor